MQANAFTSNESPSTRPAPQRSRAFQWTISLLLASGTPLSSLAGTSVPASGTPPFVSVDASAHMRAITVPFSSFATNEARTAYARLFAADHHAPEADANIAVRRAYYDRFNSALARRAAEIYPVRIESKVFGSVNAEVIKIGRASCRERV